MTVAKQSSGELRTRVNFCLNKLSDRDTLSMATNELETIARGLPNDSFAPFLSCLSATDSSDKSPVRRHCVRLLGFLSAVHGDALSPHLSRMIYAVLRRLRDPDSAVRAACVDAISSITTHVTSPPFSLILKPLVDALFHEQDLNAQISASLCLSAAVEAALEPDAAELRKILPRILKLLKTESFKSKSALLMFVGSIVRADCVKNNILLGSVVSTAVEFLSNKDWAARKAAAEVLEKVALAERDCVTELKASCVAALDKRRFDKVKVVRETMNRALEIWRDIPGSSDEVSSPEDSSNGGHSPVSVSRSPTSTGFRTPHSRKTMQNRSPASSSCSSTTSSYKSVLRNDEKKTSTPKPNLNKNFMSRVVPFNGNDSSNIADEDGLFSTRNDLSPSKDFQNLVVPFNGNDNLNISDGDGIEDDFGNQNELEDLSLIRKQLLQIENQQSSLLELLQKFIGNSQKGMSSLEKRVDGLEKVLDEISHDFVVSSTSGRIVGSDTCCMIPGAEFLSPKFWRKTEGGCPNLNNNKVIITTPLKTHPSISIMDADTTCIETSRNDIISTK